MPTTFTPTDTATDDIAAARTSPPATATTLVCLPALAPEGLTAALDTIAAAFPAESVLVAANTYPDAPSAAHNITLIPYPADRANLGWVLAAADYAAASRLAADRNISTLLLLGDQPAHVSAHLLRALADATRTGSADLTLPRFNLPPSGGLVNSALLYPISRALFGTDIHFPLPICAAISSRMAGRLASATQRLVTVNQGASLFWPVAEASIAGYTVHEIDAADTLPPAPPSDDFNTLFGNVAGSLFTDIESRASFWQRARTLPNRTPAELPHTTSDTAAEPVTDDISSIIENFHLAQANLQEIWSLVLPPQSRLAFKKLSQLPAASFAMDPSLWARTVYDFALAFHLRTLNRNHLLGAMTPLYLAWVASHLRAVADDPARATAAIEQTAAAFESEKSYFVSRWRWPDRFNP